MPADALRRLPSSRADGAACSAWLEQRISEKPVGHFVRGRHGAEARRPAAGARRVWSMITFGYELTMLKLHMRVLQPVVSGFFVAESTSTFANINTRHLEPNKPALLSEAIANNSFPTDLAAMTHVTVLTAEDAKRLCKHHALGGAAGCFEAVQYYAAMMRMLRVATVGDLAILGDVDEIASPDVVRMLQTCAPWWGDDGELERDFVWYNASTPPRKYVLLAWEYKFGIHCFPDDKNSGRAPVASWRHGPQVFSVSWLMAESQNNLTKVTGIRDERVHGLHSRHYPVVREAAWHLTSFGGADELQRKLKTWGHADMFNEARMPGVLDRDRLERCARYCLSPLGFMDPMLSMPSARRSQLEAQFRQRYGNGGRLPAPPCEGRDGVFDSRLPGSVLTAADFRSERVTRWFPSYLLEHRAKFSSYFQFLTPKQNRSRSET